MADSVISTQQERLQEKTHKPAPTDVPEDPMARARTPNMLHKDITGLAGVTQKAVAADYMAVVRAAPVVDGQQQILRLSTEAAEAAVCNALKMIPLIVLQAAALAIRA